MIVLYALSPKTLFCSLEVLEICCIMELVVTVVITLLCGVRDVGMFD